MTETTLGIVLTTIPYNDRITLLRIYTERWGRQTYRVSLARGRRGVVTRAMLSPLTLVSLVATHNEKTEIQRIAEAETLIATSDLALTDAGRAAQCFYMAELVDRTVREEEANATLWTFLEQAVRLLAATEEGSANFHLVFTARLSYLLGFRVDMESWAEGRWFDVQEGVFTPGPVPHAYYLEPAGAARLYELLRTDLSSPGTLSLGREQRGMLLDMMLAYLRLHLPDMGELKSVGVLKELFA